MIVVQILTAFPFHSLHYVALRIAMTSITCLPLQGLPSVNSEFPFGNKFQPSETLYLNNASYNLVFIAIFMRSCRTEISTLYFNLLNLYELHYLC